MKRFTQFLGISQGKNRFKQAPNAILVQNLLTGGYVSDEGNLWNPVTNTIVQGSYNGSTGAEINSTTRLRTAGYIPVNPNVSYTIDCNIPYIFVMEYSAGEKTVLLEEQTVNAGYTRLDAMGGIDPYFSTLTITFDGVPYVCSLWYNNGGDITFGSGAVYDGSAYGDDVPFAVSTWLDSFGFGFDSESERAWDVTTVDDGATHTIKIEVETKPTYLNKHSGWKESPYTFTASANTGNIRLVLANDTSSNGSGINVTDCKRLRIEEYDTKVQFVVTGNESFSFSSNNKAVYFMYSELTNIPKEKIVYATCSHFTFGSGNVLAEMNNNEFIFNITSATGLATGNVSFKKVDVFTSSAKAVDWFKEQKANGTPVIVTCYIKK